MAALDTAVLDRLRDDALQDVLMSDLLHQIRAICIEARTHLGDSPPLSDYEAVEKIIELAFPEGQDPDRAGWRDRRGMVDREA